MTKKGIFLKMFQNAILAPHRYEGVTMLDGSCIAMLTLGIILMGCSAQQAESDQQANRLTEKKPQAEYDERRLEYDPRLERLILDVWSVQKRLETAQWPTIEQFIDFRPGYIGILRMESGYPHTVAVLELPALVHPDTQKFSEEIEQFLGEFLPTDASYSSAHLSEMTDNAKYFSNFPDTIGRLCRTARLRGVKSLAFSRALAIARKYYSEAYNQMLLSKKYNAYLLAQLTAEEHRIRNYKSPDGRIKIHVSNDERFPQIQRLREEIQTPIFGKPATGKGPTERLTKKTQNGAEFKRASEADLRAAGVTNPKKFGEAWEDRSGMIWSDIAKKEDGSPLLMNHKDGEAYCHNVGAELPSGWQEDQNGKHGFPNRDSDFVRLRKYMGAEYAAGANTPNGYAAQILPNLTTTDEKGEIWSQWHWSSSVHPAKSNAAYGFNGGYGYVDYFYRSGGVNDLSVRCVVRAADADL